MVRSLVLNLVIMMTSWVLVAQPCFSPSITSPRLDVFSQNSVLFCDNDDTEVLSTQTYDTYQWYRQEWSAFPGPNPNPWIPITGANSQSYTINGTDDLLYYFKVVATLDTCTAESPAILADGYAFGLPYIFANFQPGTFESLGNGEYNVCDGASVLLANGFDQVYGLHTWYDCVPSDIPPVADDPCIIPGVTGDTCLATTSGLYGFWSCTAYCPDICLFLGLPNFIKLNFGNWPFCATAMEEPMGSNSLSLHPNPSTQYLSIGNGEADPIMDITIVDMTGKVVWGYVDYDCRQPIDISQWPAGTYWIVAHSKTGGMSRNRFIKI